MHESEEQSNPGGLAPADRQCHYTKSDGHPCRDWTLRGHHHCFRHHRYLHARPEVPIDVPLLEDEASIVYLLSQTLQALAWGTIPVPNGHALLKGCRLAHAIETTRLENAKLRVKLRRLGIPEHEIFESGTNPERTPELSAPSPEPAAGPEPVANPKKVPPKNLRFRDLKKDWDKSLQRTRNQAGDMYFKRYGETQEEFKAARATPFENLAAQDREVERAISLAKSQSETCLPTC